MFWKFTIFLLLAVTPFGSVSAESKSGAADESFAEYIAGVSLLASAKKSMAVSVQMHRFEQLKKLTGLNSEKVKAYLLSIRDNPEKGKQLYERMTRLYVTGKD